MNERLFDKIDRLARESGIKEVTPAIRRFAFAIRKDQCDTIEKMLGPKDKIDAMVSILKNETNENLTN